MKNQIRSTRVMWVVAILVIFAVLMIPQKEDYRPWWWRRRPKPVRAAPPLRALPVRGNDVRTIGCPPVNRYNPRTSYPGNNPDNYFRYCTSMLSSRTDGCKKELCRNSYFNSACRDECRSV